MAPGRIEFQGGGPMYAEMRRRVREVLADEDLRRGGERAMYVKAAVFLLTIAVTWALMVFAADAWWQTVPLAVLLAVALAGLGFNVSHDANHGSYSSNRLLNRSMRWTFDLMGASSYVWRTKHNVAHHTYTNVAGADADIDSMPFARFAPDQRRHPWHRWQHVYLWPLYGLVATKWYTFGDAAYLIKGRVEQSPLRWPRGAELVGFLLGKVAFLSWTLIVPMLFRPVWQVLAVFALVSFVLALIMVVVFQLAHCLEEADFASVDGMAGAGRTEWAWHQLETTCDFAPGNRLLTWYLGGLNYQVEHHLFSTVPHTHHPLIAPIVREVCREYGAPYHVHPTFRSALASHQRWLRRMGAPEPVATAPAAA
jgi:linoleoyl-CoA desaturase